MKLFKMVSSISVITLIALLYVHQQVELVKLSYAIEYKEKSLKDILDRRDMLGYNIDNLEAPSRLERVLISRNIDMAFPRKGNVVKIAKYEPKNAARRHAGAVSSGNRTYLAGLFDFMGLRSEAQANEK